MKAPMKTTSNRARPRGTVVNIYLRDDVYVQLKTLRDKWSCTWGDTLTRLLCIKDSVAGRRADETIARILKEQTK